MYAKTCLTTSQPLAFQPATVEVGISSGLPIIHILGDVTGRYIRNSQKLYFIFNNTGRKLPNKKIRVLISTPDHTLQDEGIDLAIFTAIYAALNDLATELENHICIGDISLEGNVTASERTRMSILNALEWNLRQDQNMMILIPDIEIPETLQKNIVRIKNIKDVYAYFEGRISHVSESTSAELGVINHSDIINPQSSTSKWIGWQIANRIHRSVIYVTDASYSLLDSPYFTPFQVQEDPVLNFIMNKDSGKIQILSDNEFELLYQLSHYKLFSPKSLIIDLRRNSLKNSDPLKLGMLVDKYCLNIIISHCPCGNRLTEGMDCTCSSIEYQRHRSMIKQMVEAHQTLIIDEGVLANSDDDFIDLSINYGSSAKDLGSISLCKTIQEVVRDIDKKRAIKLARLLTTVL